ncbi:hypothetical protein SteCoe_26759 [Stentor coeruleus]|uniref:USP domain-containing protein n=1 Tax=Stentor coeruleus TaxID=5963 RepID=A0A1R2BC36_9CILI|nr:hypothetical protein SteCoe_26759 [Stentor coeruleus]
MKKGVKGLENLKNTCYINSVIQLLSQVHPVKVFFQEDTPKHFSGTLQEYFLFRITQSLQDIIIEIWKNNKHSIHPQRLVQACWNLSPSFTPKTQQDSQEFLLILLDKLKEDPYCSDLIEKTFKGTLIRKYTCEKCSLETESFENFYTLPLDLAEESIIKPDDPFLTNSDCSQLQSLKENLKNNSFLKKLWVNKIITLYDCLKYTERTEIIEKNCELCMHNTRHNVIEKIHQGSKYIFAYLKRFKLSMWNNKIKTHVYLPKKLDGKRFGHEGSEYKLIGVIEHSGFMLFGGHYEAYILNCGLWYHINDDNVIRCNWNDVLEAQAYIFLYELEDFSNTYIQLPSVSTKRVFTFPENPFRVKVIPDSDSDNPEVCISDNPEVCISDNQDPCITDQNSPQALPRKSNSFIIFNQSP